MVKKKAKKGKKIKKAKKKKIVRRKKTVRKAGGKRQKAEAKEKVVGRIDHFFGHISVAAFKVKASLKVGDLVHIKGHTTDFVQRIDSIQSNHKDMQKAAKGVEIGIKVKGKCRVGDTVFLAAKEQGMTAQPAAQQPMFPAVTFGQARPQAKPTPPAAKPKPKPASAKTYENKKFFQF